MAIAKQASKQSKRGFMSFILIIFLSWLLLLCGVLSLWGLLGFDKAWQFLYTLAKHQTMAVRELNTPSIAEHFKSWESNLPTKALANQLNKTKSFIKNKLTPVISNDSTELYSIREELVMLIRQLGLLTKLTLYITGIKLLILFVSIPLFALAITVGLVDGLNQRAIRTASLGRESSYVFHQLNRYFKKGLLTLLAFWLILPLCIAPTLFFIPVSILLGLMAAMAASRFKKYW